MKAASVLVCVGMVVGCGGTSASGSGGEGGGHAGGSGGNGTTSTSSSTTSSSGGGGPMAGPCEDPVLADPGVKQALPQKYVDTAYVAPAGKTIAVPAGGDLQKALDDAQPGDVITLAAGASYPGPFTLPNKPGSAYIVVRTDTPDASFPAPGTRVGPADAPKMARLVAPDMLPAILTSAGAHHYRFVGVEIAPVNEAATIYTLVSFGDGATSALSDVPHHLILDRSFVHGTPSGYTKRGVQLDCADCAVIDSHVSDCHVVGQDAQAVGGWNGPGPIKLDNNYLEGSGENVMFGGADPAIVDLVPSDIEIRRNHFDKPLSWREGDPSYAGIHWTVKNLFELKNAARVLFRCNVLEHSWADAQAGFAVVLTPRNQDGAAPWSRVSDVTLVDNVIRRSSAGINILGEDAPNPSQQTARIVIANNVMEGIDSAQFGGAGRLFQIVTGGKPTDGLAIEHNTAFVNGSGALVMGDTVPVASGLAVRYNVLSHGDYGIFGSSKGEGVSALEFYAPGYVVTGNVLIGYPEAQYPAGNSFPATVADVGFVNAASGDYALDAKSPFKGQAPGGKDPGADVEAVRKRTAGVAP